MTKRKSTLQHYFDTTEFSLASSSRPTKAKKILPSIRQTYFPNKMTFD